MRKIMTGFRHELKFLINERDKVLLQERLKYFLELDKFVQGENYRVTSLYFDDYRLSGYFDKLNGEAARVKYRLRSYNLDPKVIKLEVKVKKGEMVKKESLPLTYQAYEKLIGGRRDWGEDLKTTKKELKAKICLAMEMNLSRPKIVVDYQRTPYVWKAEEMRITFDEKIQMSVKNPDFLCDNKQVYQEVLRPGMAILEVKYQEFMPQLWRELLSEMRLTRISYSKYCLSQQVARSRYQLM